jgi:3-oxoacyl-[acyl-carrier-protein] synthase II
MSGRVVITGIGVVSALGLDRTAFLDGLRAGRCALAADANGLVVGAAKAFVPPSHPSRADALGVAAAREAVRDAGDRDWSGAAVVMGVGAGGAERLERYVFAGPEGRADDLAAFPPANTTIAVAEAIGARGPKLSLMTACSASAMAIGRAVDLLRTGRAQIALAGGAEPLSHLTLSGFSALRALAPEPCRPFDVKRRGLSIGEGAAVLVLEDAAAAHSRGARIYCEIAGWGASADAHHMTAPSPSGEGAIRAMTAALRDAQIPAQAIEYVNAHGTGTPHNDPAEALAILRVLGDRVAVGSTKSQVGHTLAAAGAIEAAATALGLAYGFLPATVTLGTPDPACPLEHVAGRPREQRVRAALSSSFGFGGNNVVLVFSVPSQGEPLRRL